MASSLSFDQRIEMVVPRLQAIVHQIQTDPNPKVVQLRDEAMTLIRAQDLISVRKVRADCVGVHPSNRYGDGVVPAHVHRLIERIYAQGFSTSELDKAYAVEAAPLSHPLQESHAKLNHEMVMASQGLLPEYDSAGARIQIFSATCGHTNQGLRCFFHGAPSNHEALSEGGRLSLGYLHEKSPSYADAVENGITWEIIPWQVEAAVEGIMSLFKECMCAPKLQQLFHDVHGSARMHVCLLPCPP